MLRKILLSALMLGSLVVMLPLVNSTAHNIKYSSAQNHRRVRRHSRAWWRRHHVLIRRRRAALLRRRALVEARRNLNSTLASENHAASPEAVSLPPAILKDAKSPVASIFPSGWTPSAPSKGETVFRVNNPNGSSAGQAVLSVVAASSSAPPLARVSVLERSRILAGISFSELRRTVIDKMITTGGWVVNDLQREIGGRKVFIVVAQTPGSNDGREPERIWNFYFTEVDGRIYSLSTSAARETSGRLANDAEKFLNSLPAMAPAGSRNSPR
jgi:hypothetical protein